MLERISHFRILREVGRGGMGVVYEAMDEQLGRRVAIKTLISAQGRRLDKWALERFKTEAKAAAQITDPRIVQVYEAGEYEGTAYIAMEFVEGVDLADLIQAAADSPGEFLQLSSNITKMVGNILDTSSSKSALAAVQPGSSSPSDLDRPELMMTADGWATPPTGHTPVDAPTPPGGSRPFPSGSDPRMDETPASGMMAVTPPSGIAGAALEQAAETEDMAPETLDMPVEERPSYQADQDIAGTQLLQDYDIEEIVEDYQAGKPEDAGSDRSGGAAKDAPASARGGESTPKGDPSEEASWEKLRVASPKLSEEYIRFIVEMIREASEVLDVAHRIGVVHRDIKPHNIMITRDGKLKVADFGLSRLDATPVNAKEKGAAMGTPAYMSPEQCRGEADLDGRTDVYSLGVTLFQLLTFRTPFTGSFKEMAGKIINEPPVAPRSLSPSIPVDIDTIILKCLFKRADDRYASAAELGADLGRYLNFEPILARRIGMSGRFYRWVRRSPLRATLVASVIVSVVVIAVVASRGQYEPKFEEDASSQRDSADPQHPSYREAVAVFDLGVAAHEEGKYKDAYVHFKDAAEKFAICRTWDLQLSEGYEAARTAAEAREEHPVVLVAARSYVERAERARASGDYQAAYEDYQRATDLLRFKLTIHKEVEAASQAADESHPKFPLGKAAEGEAIEHLSVPEQLKVDHLRDARGSYQEALRLYRLCKPWDESYEEAVLQAKATADTSRVDIVRQAEALVTEAGGLRSEGEYYAAYTKLESAAGLYASIATGAIYDTSHQQRARKMQNIAVRSAPGFAEAERLFEGAGAAQRRGDYQESYELYESARQAYRETRPYDPRNEDRALEAKEMADPELPEFQKGEELEALALKMKADLDYELADQYWRNAWTSYYRAQTYDPEFQEEAEAAMSRGSKKVKIPWRQARKYMAEAEDAVATNDYKAAYKAFREAKKLYDRCEYDPEIGRQALRAYDQAYSGHHLFAVAEDKYLQAKALLDEDGPGASELFLTAIDLFAQCVKDASGTARPAGWHPPEPQEMRKAVADATKARDVSTELKEERDSWDSQNRVSAGTRNYYESGNELFARASELLSGAARQRKEASAEKDAARVEAIYPSITRAAGQATELFKQATAKYSKVYRKGR